MYSRIVCFAWLVAGLTACTPDIAVEEHDGHGEDKIQITEYSSRFELFAEADAFVTGDTSQVLAHFSTLPDFRALEEGSITLILTVNGRETRQTLARPTRKGIYSFSIVPQVAGTGTLRFEIESARSSSEIISQVRVFQNREQAVQSQAALPARTNTIAFTKEQSWKIDFSTGYPEIKPFGQVIKATALVEASSGSEMAVIARSAGMVSFMGDQWEEGMEVSMGRVLFTVSDKGFTNNSLTVRYAEAKSNYERAVADYERAKELAKERIVPEKELLSAKNEYETTKAIFDNLKQNTGEKGSLVTSPLTGFIRKVLVQNGSFVEAGQTVMVVSQDKDLVVTAQVPQRYAPLLGTITTANIRGSNGQVVYTLEQLNGKVISYGKATNSDNHLLPVSLRISNRGNFIPGSFVEVHLKPVTNSAALVVPETALLEEQGNFFVWVQVNPELFEKREVKTGATDGIDVEILDGIRSDERIVTRGAIFIKLAQATGTLDAHSGHVH